MGELLAKMLDETAEQRRKDDSSSLPAAVPAAKTTAAAPAKTIANVKIIVDVDENGTGAMMNRSPASGGASAPLMVCPQMTKALGFPIDAAAREAKAEAKSNSKNKPT